MARATIARFERFSRRRRSAAAVYTAEQRRHWTETDYNWHLRHALMQQGFRALHLREGSETGIPDVIVYHQRLGSAFPDRPAGDIAIAAWLELKQDDDEESIRPAQRQFMKDHWSWGRNAMFVMRDRVLDGAIVRQGDLEGRPVKIAGDPYAVKWQEVFNKFRKRG